MSHVVSIKTELKDLEAIRRAAAELGLQFIENQTSYKWWGTTSAGATLPEGFKASDLGKCVHAIKVPGTTWEIGVAAARNADGSPKAGFTLLWDFYGTQGAPIAAALGEGAKRFVQLYGVHKATLELQKRGLTVTRKAGAKGSIQLVATQY